MSPFTWWWRGGLLCDWGLCWDGNWRSLVAIFLLTFVACAMWFAFAYRLGLWRGMRRGRRALDGKALGEHLGQIEQVVRRIRLQLQDPPRSPLGYTMRFRQLELDAAELSRSLDDAKAELGRVDRG